MATETDVRITRLFLFPAEEYDAYVASACQALPYHHRAWLSAVVSAYRHRAWIVSAHQDDRLCGVLPLVEVKRPIGAPELVSLPFCDLAGPLADTDAIALMLVEGAKQLARASGAGLLELRHGGEPLSEEEVAAAGPVKVRMVMALPENSEALFRSFRPKLRSQIRKAGKNGLRAEIRTDPQAVHVFYEVFAANMRRLGSPVHARDWFEALQEGYGDQMLVGLVYQDTLPVGAGIVLVSGQRACIPWASTLAEFNHLAPNMLLYWTLLSHVCDQGCREFDFGRSTLGEGTYRFKKQWGARPWRLIWEDPETGVRRLDKSAGITSRRGLRPLLEGIWRRLPLALVNRVGPMFRRYITL